ncbi:MAG: hypothetical protein GY754_42955 [bacterium]|nr:hypothetical protein [bacterium]
MENKVYEKLYSIAEDFREIAQNVNESSLKRKDHSKKAIENIDLSDKAGANLLREIQSIFKQDSNLRDQHNFVLNTIKIMMSNLGNQADIIKELKAMKSIKPAESKVILDANKKLTATLKKGETFVSGIVETDNEIILMDNLIINRKKFQKERIKALKKSTSKILKDAESAVAGSHSNIGRGVELAKRLKDVEKLVNKGDKKTIKKIAEEANTGWKLAVKVNNSSKTQFEFAEQVNLFTKQLHEESIYIKDMVARKHDLFNQNLEPITEVAVLVAVEMQEYVGVADVIKDLPLSDITLDEKTYSLLSDVASYIKAACDNAEFIAEFNYDMTDSIASNAHLMEETVKLTREETEKYATVKKEVAAMTEATRYPVEGSGKNIANGQEVEKTLKEIITKV